MYLEPVCPLFWGLNPPKEGPFHSKQGSFGFQVFTIHHGRFLACHASLPRVIWLLLSDEQMGKKMPFSPPNDEQTSNWLGVKHLPVMYTGVSKNIDTPKSSILIGFSIINYPFWVPLYLEISIYR